MLATRVFALFPYQSENYSVADIFTALLFNGVGCIIYAWLLSITRFGNSARLDNLENIVNSRFTDSYAGIFVMAVFCGFLVACGCLTGKSFPENKGVSMALTVFFIATFVLIAPEHIVADFFFFAYWSISNMTFTPEILPILLFSALGNAVGGIGAGYLDLIRRKGS
jgi:formate/nitrite transporter FocA (FNT family)